AVIAQFKLTEITDLLDHQVSGYLNDKNRYQPIKYKRQQSDRQQLDRIPRRLANMGKYRGPYRMRIYERENFGGQMYELTDDCESFMDRYRMSDCQSCHVMDGHWLMYEQPHYRGRMIYFRPGEYRSFRDMGYSNTRFSSVRRIMDLC
ncbi:hypothetical protein cypCar_00045179, partial [Cyprinus carpio]